MKFTRKELKVLQNSLESRDYIERREEAEFESSLRVIEKILKKKRDKKQS